MVVTDPCKKVLLFVQGSLDDSKEYGKWRKHRPLESPPSHAFSIGGSAVLRNELDFQIMEIHGGKKTPPDNCPKTFYLNVVYNVPELAFLPTPGLSQRAWELLAAPREGIYRGLLSRYLSHLLS